MKTIRLGISTCPNDTFAFHGLINRLVDWRGLEFDVQLMDIQQLNDRLFVDQFDVAKASFHAALLLSSRTTVLPSGSALGFGVGPLLLAASDFELPIQPLHKTVCPGQHTTATLLLKIFYPQLQNLSQVCFDEIMPALSSSSADLGVCIHEGRFTWQQHGLNCVEDLGARWEAETGKPLPLGGIIASNRLSKETVALVQSVIRASLEHAIQNPQSALPTMRRYAQEFDDSVLLKHVELYVNDWTVDLGTTGAAALDELSDRAKSVGITSLDAAPLRVADTC